MDVHFIVNERSGNGKGKKVWIDLKDQLTISYFEHFTQYSGHGALIASSISAKYLNHEDYALIVVVGGDGTIHEIVNGISRENNLYIGFVQAGSGNDFSRAYQTFHTAKEIEWFTKNPSGTKLDCGQVLLQDGKKRRFVNSSGIGFDAFVSNKANDSKLKDFLNKVGLGKLSYGLLTIGALFTFKRFEVEVIVDERRMQFPNAWFVTVSNQPYFGGGMKLSPLSKTDDGFLEITVVHRLSHWKLLFLFGTVFLGTHTKLSEVTQLKGKQFQITVTKPQYLHTDGEVIDATKEKNLTFTYDILENYWLSAHLDRNTT